MKSLIRWAVSSAPAMNTLMLAIFVVGLMAMFTMRREVFPEFELEIILVSVPYPGASPEEVEDGICQKVEEAVQSIAGIKKQTSVALEGAGYLVLELETHVRDVQKVLSEVRSAIDRIPSLPELSEEPEIKQLVFRQSAIMVGVVGSSSDAADAELQLRDVAEQVRTDLLMLPSVSQAKIVGAKEYQIDVEISESTLRKHGLSLKQVADIIRRENVDLPGGSMKTESQEVLLRAKNKRTIGKEIGAIPIVSQQGGVVLTVSDLAAVRDEFIDAVSVNEINGRPGMAISVDKTSDEDLLAIVEDVKDFVAKAELPQGYELITWADRSVEVRERMEMLAKNGIQGLILVFLLLSLFLEMRLAFWVAWAIPLSIIGACGVLLYAGQTLNMLSMYAFLMVLGMVVDDGIVIGENIFEHRMQGKSFFQAAVDGTAEVIPSISAAVMTTICAYLPLAYVSGVMGKFIAVMPLAVIATLLISLFEAIFMLPGHLARQHAPDEGDRDLVFRTRRFINNWLVPVRWTLGYLAVALAWTISQFLYPFRVIGALFKRFNRICDGALKAFIDRLYRPVIRWCLQNPAVVLSSAMTLLLVAAGLYRAGVTPYVMFPKVDANVIEAMLIYPEGTPSSVPDEASRRLEAAILKINDKYAKTGKPVVKVWRRGVGHVTSTDAVEGERNIPGSHLGGVSVELVESSEREVSSQNLIAEWRAATGEFPGIEKVSFRTPSMGPGGQPIEFKLLSDRKHFSQLEAAVEECKARLAEFPGIFDINDDSRPGKWEFQIRIKQKAQSMGVQLEDLANTVRSAYYGAEVMRLQRGRHEVKLMVRYPPEERSTFADFDDIYVRTGDGVERPLTELADITVERGYGEINRIDQLRSITVTADVDEATGNAANTVADLQAGFMPQLFQKYPNVRVRWEGQQAESAESVNSLAIGFLVALFGMFVLLAVEFRSYWQPFMIMLIIPFGVVGAVGGHAILGMPLTLFSIFGLVALCGVVVNDAIVLIDFINLRLSEGLPLYDALVEAGCRRFRPVLLTSVTTIGGLCPILFETSLQAQILIPMATSLAFGLALSTLLVLILMPTLYLVFSKTLGLHQEAPQDNRTEELASGEGLHSGSATGSSGLLTAAETR